MLPRSAQHEAVLPAGSRADAQRAGRMPEAHRVARRRELGEEFRGDTREFAINASNSRFWEPAVKRYVDECLAGQPGRHACGQGKICKCVLLTGCTGPDRTHADNIHIRRGRYV